jgi:hypothetical protein
MEIIIKHNITKKTTKRNYETKRVSKLQIISLKSVYWLATYCLALVRLFFTSLAMQKAMSRLCV